MGQSERGNWFDTFSFLAVNPTGQEPDANTGEADDANWFPPALLIDGWRAGLVRFAPPTWMHLLELSDHRTVADAFAAADSATITPIVDVFAYDERISEFFDHAPRDRIGRRSELTE